MRSRREAVVTLLSHAAGIPLSVYPPGVSHHRGLPGRIVIHRNPGRRDRLRSYAIILDGVVAGKIREGETQDLQVSPGAHRLRLKCDWARSQEVALTLADGESVQLTCQSGTRLVFALLESLWDRDNYIHLSRDES